jgi:hypothetical protein
MAMAGASPPDAITIIFCEDEGCGCMVGSAPDACDRIWP